MRLLPGLLLVVLGTSACKSGDKPRPATTGSGSAAVAATGVDEAEARAFAEKLVLGVRPCNPDTVGASFETPAYATMFCEWMYGITSYRLVGVRTVDGRPRPILRRFRVDADGALRVSYDA